MSWIHAGTVAARYSVQKLPQMKKLKFKTKLFTQMDLNKNIQDQFEVNSKNKGNSDQLVEATI
jgi:hypothetical protein